MHFDTPFQLPGTVGFLLGTDDLGRDILSRTLYGIRASLVVGRAVACCSPSSSARRSASSAGYWRWLDAIVSRLTDLMLAFPFLILAVGLAAISGPSLANAVVALGIAQIPTMIRVVRGETLRLRSADFVAARPGDGRQQRRGSCPPRPAERVSAIIVQATVIMPVAVIGEALLSFLGLGIQPPAAEPRASCSPTPSSTSSGRRRRRSCRASPSP